MSVQIVRIQIEINFRNGVISRMKVYLTWVRMGMRLEIINNH